MTQILTDAASSAAQNEDELAYEMVVALLEYQLSSPVQWIATQDELLGMGHQDQRFIEIGPSATLAAMMKKTLAQSGANKDVSPECLTFSDELNAINKESEPEPEPEPESNGEDDSGNASPAEPAPAVTTPTPQPVAALVVQAPVVVGEIEDAPATASDVVLAIVASGLKMARDNLDVTQSVKFLSKGRSSLQNEIVGNLAAELGQLPEAVEAMPLAELIHELQAAHKGKLGPFLTEWLNKRVSAKLAPSVTVSALRAHLQSSYGLKKGRQDTLLLTVDFDRIPTRLAEQESWKLVAEWADAYVQSRGLQRASQSNGQQQQQQQQPGGQMPGATMSSPHLAKFARDLSELMAKHFPSQEGDEEALAVDDTESADITEHLADELGSEFIAGTKPYFRPELVYQYKSGWNWALQDLYVTLSGVIARSTTLPEEELREWVQAQGERLRARKTERLLRCAQFLLEKWEKSQTDSPTSAACRMLLRNVLSPDSLQSALETLPYIQPSRRTVPRTTISDDGHISYEEVPVAMLTDAGPSLASTTSSLDDGSGLLTPCLTQGSDTPDLQLPDSLCPVWISTNNGAGWKADEMLTRQLQEAERRFGVHGHLPVEGTTLIIGAGQRSIGFMLARLLLQAGCRVVMTTGRLTPENRKVISQMYAESAKPGAELVLLPFNQGSVQDIQNAIEHIHSTLHWEIDHLVPFAGVSSNGKNLEDVDSVSELALRVMLTNTIRLMGHIVASKRRRGVLNHSTQVLVPLSPNHGQFGNDGLYAESKLALEALLNKVHSEPWGEYLAICGVRIGWTRGTGLMNSNNIFAEAMEELGARTFAADEMATLLALVMTPDLAEACSLEPILCEFSGGLGDVRDLGACMAEKRGALEERIALGKQLRIEADQDAALARGRPVTGDGSQTTKTLTPSERRGRLSAPEPVLPARYEDAVPANAADFRDLYDLDSMVVITGFSELGSAGSSRTRWELEAEGQFSLEGCIELAWMMGFIRYERQRKDKGQAAGPGWVESDSGLPIRDMDVKFKYEARICAHTGIRVLEMDDDPHANPDTRLRDLLHEVGTQEDLPPFDCSSQAAAELRAHHGDAVELLSDDGTTARVRVRSGATIFIPKALGTHYYVGAQVPQGWDAARYGVPHEIAAQTDKPGLYTLVCAVEAFLSAGVTDVYELYKYLHVSELGNCIGSGAGGVPAFRRCHEHRLLGREVPNDNISEGFVGTAAAWVNLLLMSASGPIKSGAGTCATSLESLDTACELISSGRTRVCLAGGYDVFSRPVYYEFGDLGAIVDNARDERGGRAPHEMSRPFTSTRGGFVLGEGVGIQVVASASLALEMGLPIYGVVALTHMAADKLGRSVPAPGRGILTAAKQPAGPVTGPVRGLMAPALRSRLLRDALDAIDDRTTRQVEAAQGSDGGAEPDWVPAVQAAAAVEKKAVRKALGQEYWRNNPDVSPLVGALSIFGLTIDDISFASLHGTGTKLNDVNECATVDQQMRHLGRHAGNPILTVAQKSVVGHGLGASGAFALNGGLQAMHAGVVPGNRNADDIDGAMAAYDRVLLTNANVALPRADMKAFTVNSFGFGQKGAQALIVHPRYLLAALGAPRYYEYREKHARRACLAARHLDRGLRGQGLFRPRDDLPYVGDEYEYLMNPRARREFS